MISRSCSNLKHTFCLKNMHQIYKKCEQNPFISSFYLSTRKIGPNQPFCYRDTKCLKINTCSILYGINLFEKYEQYTKKNSVK